MNVQLMRYYLRNQTVSFNAFDYGTPTVWLDSTDDTVFDLTTGLVDEWRDKSGNDNHLTATLTNRPTKSGDSIEFLNSTMTFATPVAPSGAFTHVFVVDTNNKAQSNQFFIGNSGSGLKIGISSANTLFLRLSLSPSTTYTTSYTPASNTRVVISVYRTAANFIFLKFDDDAAIDLTLGVANSGTLNFNQVGNDNLGNDWNGQINQIITYDADISGSNLDNLILKLKQVYSIV